jgi:hypothetical protein
MMVAQPLVEYKDIVMAPSLPNSTIHHHRDFLRLGTVPLVHSEEFANRIEHCLLTPNSARWVTTILEIKRSLIPDSNTITPSSTITRV